MDVADMAQGRGARIPLALLAAENPKAVRAGTCVRWRGVLHEVVATGGHTGARPWAQLIPIGR